MGRGGSNKYLEYPSQIAIGVTAFTPLELDNPLPVVGDRPFANVVFLSTARTRVLKKRDTYITNSFNYGLIGSNIANTFQSWAHEKVIKGRPTDISWDHQISRGGRPAFLFTHQVTRPIRKTIIDVKDKADRDSVDAVKKWRINATIGYDLKLGWYNSIGSTLTLRFGKFSKHSVINMGSPLAVAEYSGDTPKISAKKQVEFYGFASFSPRMTPYNSLILGQPFHDSEYTLLYEDYNPLAVDIKYGLVIANIKTKTRKKHPFLFQCAE